ncbi:MAG: Gfo/Idh/MocA family protein [Isosphaeraceae bacterium]
MASGEIRIGIIGAGRISRARHLPGFQSLPGVKVVGICNRRRETAARVAREFDIPRIYGNWEDLAADPAVDAVVIGAWPYLHCPVTLAALDAGKHVLTEARMAMNAREAQRMLDRSLEAPRLTAMIVPSPYGLTGDAFMRSLISSGWLGELREVHVHGLSDTLADADSPLSWRQMTRYSGFNMLSLGILYETVLRWVSPVNRVVAYASKLIPHRLDPEQGKRVKVGTPDSVQVLTTQEDGSCGVYRLSGVVWHESAMGVALYGSEGTLIYDLARDEIRGARRGDEGMRSLAIPDAIRGGWQVEADFVAAIRGERPVTRTDFRTGVRYMQFTEAVARSSRHQIPVDLPLREFSNPSL